MDLPTPTIHCHLLRRYKRFLADIRLADGTELTVHCANSGSMRGCVGEGWPAVISDSGNPKRKLRHTLELVHNGASWIVVNTHRANPLAEEAVRDGAIAELTGYASRRREVRTGDSSRLDLLLEDPQRRPCWVEVKSVTLVDGAGRHAFPDAVTSRGRKHLEELGRLVAAGDRGVLLFLILRGDGRGATVARDIDPAYGEALDRALAGGVEVLAYRATVTPDHVTVTERVEFVP